MRIAVSADALAALGGVELSTLQVSRELRRRGHELALLYRAGGDLEQRWRPLAGEVRQVPAFGWTKAHPLRDLRALRPGIRAAAATRPDVVYLNRVEHLVWGLLAARAARAPLVCHLRHHPDFPGVRLAGRGVAGFIAVSEYIMRRWVAAGLRPDRVRVVPNGVDPEDYPVGGPADRARVRAALGLPGAAFVVLCHGRVHPDKGIDDLLAAWRRLGLPPDEAVLLVVGDPYPTAEGRGYATGLRAVAPAGVRFLPRQADIVPALHAADAVAAPARWDEPFGRVVAEGLMSGRPVVATAVGGIPEQLTGDLTGLLVPPVRPGDPAGATVIALAARLDALRHWRRDDPGLGDRCHRHALARLALGPAVDGIEAVLREAVGDSPPRPAARRAGATVTDGLRAS